MDGRYTVDYLLDPAHEDDLRRLAGEVLELGPWQHLFWDTYYDCGHPVSVSRRTCAKCGCPATHSAPATCLVPDPATGPLPEIAERLLRRFQNRERYLIFEAIPKVHEFAKGPGFCPADEMEYTYAMWFLWATPTERIVCCLLVLLPA